MATKYPFDKMTRVSWVPTIASISGPTDAELDAGTDISCWLTKDGLNPGGSTNGIDAGSLCSDVDGQIAGSVSYQATLKMFRFSPAADDDAWGLVNRGDAGHLVVRRGIATATAWTAAQKVEVYKAQFGAPVPASSAANALQTFEVSLFVEDADLKATVVAG